MQLKKLFYSKKNGIATINFKLSQEINTQNMLLVNDFHTALKKVETDSDVKVLIIKGKGFSFSGNDLFEDPGVYSQEKNFQIIKSIKDITLTIINMSKPVIAALHGYVLGIGCEWAMHCDIRIAAEGTKFGFPKTKIGYSVKNRATIVSLLIGLGRAKEMVFTGDHIDADQAEKWGLLNRIVSLAELENTVQETAEKILKNYSLSIALSKKAFNQAVYKELEETLEQETLDLDFFIGYCEAAERAKATLEAQK